MKFTPQQTTSLQHQRLFFLLMGLAFVAGALFLGSRPLYDSTEARYAECARQSLAARSFDMPVLNGHPHWTKPPLTYLAIMGGYGLLGPNQWGARVYLLLAFVVSVAAVYQTGRNMWGSHRAAFFSALVFAASPFTLIASTCVSTDMLLTMWLAVVTMLFWHGVTTREAHSIRLMWMALGLAFMTKGPPCLLVLLSIVPTHYILKRNGRRPPSLFPLWGIGLFIVIGLGWYLYECIRHPGLLKYWMVEETVNRNLTGQHHRNPEFYQNFRIYLPIMLFGSLPWSLPVLIWRKRIQWPTGQWLRPLKWPSGVQWCFLMLGTFVPLAVFFASRSKLPLYVLPLFVPVSLALGRSLASLHEQGLMTLKRAMIMAGVIWGIFVIGKALSPLLPSDKNARPLAEQIQQLQKQYPNNQVHWVGDEPLNGLQFYLREQLPLVGKDEIDEVLVHEPVPSLFMGPNTLIYIMKADWLEKEKIQKALKQSPVEIAKSGQWAILIKSQSPGQMAPIN